jgi:hypothetical protein
LEKRKQNIMQIDLSVNISEEDHIKINEELYKIRNKFAKIFVNFSMIFISIAIIFVSIFKLTNEEKSDQFTQELILLILLFLVIAFAPKLRVYNHKKVYRSSKTANKTTTYSINEEIIKVKSDDSEGQVSWKAISEVIELSNWFLLMPTKITYYALPKNSLNNVQNSWIKAKIHRK